MRYYDSHNHLQDERLKAMHTVLPALHSAHAIQYSVVNGTRESDWSRVQAFSQQHSCILPSYGLHPWFVANASSSWKDQLLRLVNEQPVGIGEIGLDRWIRNYDMKQQTAAFEWQLNLAHTQNLPTTIHCLKAWGHLLEILQKNGTPDCGFLLHSYSGPREMIASFVELGAYFSFSGYFAHERKQKQCEIFKSIPIDRLLIETDAPDMLPPDSLIEAPIQDSSTGTAINPPINLIKIYEFIAEFLDYKMDDFNVQIENNFTRLFHRIIPEVNHST